MQRFTEDEAQEILRRAVRAPSDEYTSEELQRSAAELGISSEALARAEAEVREERGRVGFERALRAQVRSEVIKFASVMSLLVFINLTTSRHHLWFMYPLIFWGFSVVMTVLNARDRDGASYRRAFEKWQATNGKPGERELAEALNG